MVSSKKFQQYADRAYVGAVFQSEEEQVAKMVGTLLEKGYVVEYVMMKLLGEFEKAVRDGDEGRVEVIRRFFSFGIWGQE